MSRYFFVFCLVAIGVAGCGGGSNGGGFVGIPQASPTSRATATPKPAPANVATSVPLDGGSALSAAPVQTALPAPAGYTQSLSASFVSAAANTTLTVNAGASAPPATPVLSKTPRTPNNGRRLTSPSYDTVYYFTVSASNSITVAGPITTIVTFPAGTLATGTSYYAGFLDPTQSSPAWQTLAGPVTSSDGKTLQFTGTVPSFTFQPNVNYGFAIFATTSAQVTPPPNSSQSLVYLAQGTKGILVSNASGSSQTTLPINANMIGLDDAGNIYDMTQVYPTTAPGATSAPTAEPPVFQMYPAGSTTASRTYQYDSTYAYVTSSGPGEVAGESLPSGSNVTAGLIDVWNPGAQGAPSYTIPNPNALYYDMAHDGTIVTPNVSVQPNPSATPYQTGYNIYAPGSSTPMRTIQESIVPASQVSNFVANFMTLGPDGTLYVTEFNFFNVPDPLAGLYIYSPTGKETFVATDGAGTAQGSGPNGVALDANGNIYVANNNAGMNIFSPTNPTFSDVLSSLQVFSPGGSSQIAKITGGWDPIAVTVGSDGTAFVSSFATAGTELPGNVGTFSLVAGASTPTKVSSSATGEIVLYNGFAESAASRHRFATATSQGGMAMAAHANPTAFRRLMLARRAILTHQYNP